MLFLSAARLTTKFVRGHQSLVRRAILFTSLLLAFISWYGIRQSTAVMQNQALAAIVSGASFEADALAPDSIATVYGTGLATEQTEGTSVTVQDSAGVTRNAKLLYVSTTQVNFLVPAGTKTGLATVTVRAANGATSTGVTTINAVAPALFKAGNAPAGYALRVKGDGAQVYESVAQPITLGPADEQVFLVLYLSGVRGADPNDVRVVLGTDELTPLFVGGVGDGLDQINLALPRTLAGKGVIQLFVRAPGARGSNTAEIEIGSNIRRLEITGVPTNAVLAGEEIVLSGRDLPLSNLEVLFKGSVAEKPVDLKTDKITVRVPYGAATGEISVSVGGETAWTSTTAISVRTSLSGVIQGTDKKGIPGITVLERRRNITATTNQDGAFVLPDVLPGAQFVIVPQPGPLNYPAQTFKPIVELNRDNKFGRIELTRSDSPTPSLAVAAVEPAQTNPITLELSQCPNGNVNCPYTLTPFTAGRTPVDLPPGTFSSAIAQITPFSQPISPGGKLRFVNVNNIPAGTPVRVYKLDQNQNSATLGQFLDIGPASFNGAFLETAAGAVNEGSYYYVSRQWPTATLYGRVVEPDGVRPVRRALVTARGQSVFTDGNGSFVLRNIPMITPTGANDSVAVEVVFHRADGSVARTESATTPIAVGDVKLTSPSVLRLPPLSLVPVIIAPDTLTIYENEIRAFNVLAADPANDSTLNVGVAADSLLGAQMTSQGGSLFTLRLNPGTNTAGTYRLTITATNAQQQRTEHSLLVTVLRSLASGQLAALEQTLTTNEGQSVSVILTGRNVGASPVYEIVTPPARGDLLGSATGPNRTYAPRGVLNGVDSFTFKIRNGSAESNIARVTIAVKPKNHAPTITVPAAQTVSAGQEVRFIITANDIDPGQTLTARMTSGPSDATFVPLGSDSRQWQFSWRPRYTNVGTVNAQFSVTDNGVGQLSASGGVTITVDPKWAKTSGPEGFSIYSLSATNRAIFADRFRSNDNGASWTEMNFQPRAVAALNNTIYITGAPSGLSTGVYRSTDDGQTWTRAFDLSPLGGFFPLTVSNSTLIVGTNNGIYRSTDNGTNWQQSGLGGLNISRLAANSGTVLACTPNGNACYRSSNGGQTWGQVDALSGLSSLVANGNYFIGAKIFNGGIFRLSNTGQSWQEVNNGIPNPDIALIQSNGLSVSGTTIFAGIESLGLFRSENNGDSWTRISTGSVRSSIFSCAALGSTLFLGTRLGVHRGTGALTSFTLVNSGITNSQVRALTAQGNTILAGTYARGLFRSTNNGQSWERAVVGNADGLFFGGLAALNGTFYAGWYDGELSLQRSTDGGITWTKFTNGFTDGFTADIAVGALTVDGNTVYAGTSEGVYRLRSGAASWEPINRGLPLTSQLNVAKPPSSFLRKNLADKLTPRDWLQATSRTPQSKSALPFPIDGVLLIGNFFNAVAASGNTLFASYFNVDFDVTESRVFRSRDGGANWQSLNTGLPPVELGNTGFNGTEGLIIRGGFAYAGTPRGVYRIALDGQQWTEFSSGIGTRKVYSFAVIGDRNTGQLYAGTSNGVYLLAADEQTWVPVNASLTGIGVLSLSANGDGSALLAGTEANAVHRLSSNTQSWSDITTNISAGLRENVVRAAVIRGATIYVGTVAGGVYASTNNGQSWLPVNQGLPVNANVRALALRGAALFAAEQDGGVYELLPNPDRWVLRRGTLPTTKFNALLVNGAQLLVGTDAGVFRSSDGGLNWLATGAIGARVLSLGASNDGSTLLAGTSSGVFYSINNGVSWASASGIPTVVNALVAGGSNARLFAGTDDRGLYRSDDGGFNWVQVNNRVPSNLNVRALVTNGALVYAGSVYGVFRTSDDGASWEQINAGLTDTFVTALALRGDDLISGTVKGGVFLSKLSSDPQCVPSVTAQPADQIINAGQSAQLQVTATSASSLFYQWYRGQSGDTANPIPGATRASYSTGPISATESYWVLVSNSCGSVNSETATVALNTPPQVDLSLTQSVSPSPARAGDELTFNLTVGKSGRDAAFAVTVTDTLPQGVTYVEGSCTATGGGVCGGNGNNRTVMFASLPANDALATITLRARINLDVNASALRNTAIVNAGVVESNPNNNTASANVTIIRDNPNPPTITSLNPTMAQAGGSSFALMVNGTNFVSGAKVRWNNADRITTFVSATQLVAQIPASDIASPGSVLITVANPDGQVSGGVAFLINQTARVLRVVASSGAPGGVVAVSVELVSQGDENALGFSLTFDPAVLTSPQVALGTGAAGATLSQNLGQSAQGRLGLVLGLPANQRFTAGVRQLVVVSFTIAAATTATSTNIAFGDQPVGREVSDVNANGLPASYQGGAVAIARGIEGDVTPRPDGNGAVTVTDWVQIGRFVSGEQTAGSGGEFQRADCAPRNTLGNGLLTVSDWVQAGRYAAGLDPQTPAGGPQSPGTAATALGHFTMRPVFESWPRRVQLAPPVFGPGQTISVAVELLARGNENALSFSLQFDSRQWRFVSATAGEDAKDAVVSANAKQASNGRLGLAVALSPGRTWDVGLRSFVVVNFVATDGGGALSPIEGMGDWPTAREVAGVTAESLDADWATPDGKPAQSLVNVSSTSFLPEPFAAEAFVAAFGRELATETVIAEGAAWPQELAGTVVIVTDSQGQSHFAELLFVSPAQVNYRLPAALAAGLAEVIIRGPNGIRAVGKIEILP
ncbi:MAG: DUF11 domain-containing protein [Acidobacteria bacterium]|nr:DUF11 domain-containing protein [Acidobacteriota bacterium]